MKNAEEEIINEKTEEQIYDMLSVITYCEMHLN
jgi:hypothetical protein